MRIVVSQLGSWATRLCVHNGQFADRECRLAHLAVVVTAGGKNFAFDLSLNQRLVSLYPKQGTGLIATTGRIGIGEALQILTSK
jgi:hypothetical protein